MQKKRIHLLPFLLLLLLTACQPAGTRQKPAAAAGAPSFRLIQTDTFRFNNFVDCNMAEAWVGDTFRIFPGKYGEDPVWGEARELKFSSGRHADEAFSNPAAAYVAPIMPKNAPKGQPGLHGAVWFETVYQDARDSSGRTLYAVYHNENYPETLPYDPATGEGYIDKDWPLGLTERITPAAVCRIGIMKSTDGSWNWENKGLFLEDEQPRMILKPHNTSKTFAGGVGDPSAVAVGDYLLEAARQLLRRNRSLSPFGKTANLNFLRALKLLSAWKQSKDRTSAEKWRQQRAALTEKVRRMQPLANKDWLLEMVEE